MFLKASKIPILWQVAMLVCISILGYVYLQPAAARAIERNSSMLIWTHLVPWSGEPDLFWLGKLPDSSRSSFLVLANRFDVLCKAASSDEDITCFRAEIARLIATASRDDPLAQLDRFNQNSEAAVEIWRHVILFHGAQVAVERKDYGLASALLASLNQGYVPDSEFQRAHMARLLAELANFSVDSGKFADAEFYWRWAILQLPEKGAYHNRLGNTLARQERWEEAIAAYRDAIQLDPNIAYYYAGLANALARQERWEEAIAAYRDAIQLDPNQAHYFAGLGNALAHQERWEEAIAAYRDAIQLDSNQAHYYADLADALAHQECWEEAVAAFRLAVQLYPNSAYYYVRLAQVLVRVGETEQAVVAAQRALELNPNSAAAQRLLQGLGQD